MTEVGSPPDWSDGELVRQIAARSTQAEDAERELCARYAARIRLYGLRHLRADDAAADLVQQVLLAVLEAARAGRVEEPDRLGAFVAGVCRFVVWDVRRADQRRQRLVDAEAILLPAPETGLHPIDRRRLERCLGHLAPRETTVVRMTFQEDRPADEIARLLGLTPGNVRVIRHRALARLQACVENPMEDA